MGIDDALPTTTGGSIPEDLFESLKQVNEHGAEYWTARDIQTRLGYSEWRNFRAAIAKAIVSCEQSENDPHYHFVDANKMIGVGKGGQRKSADFHLSRFACYLIAQNGDPRKAEIAFAQKYFAIQTRRQELSDQLVADRERIGLREDVRRENKQLSGAARKAGVQNSMFGVFNDAGYKGLYNDLGMEAIKRRKGIPKEEDLLDRMSVDELAPNLLVRTQTKEQLARVDNQHAAIQTHFRVGRIVRGAIDKIGGTMPEDLKPDEHIKETRKRVKKAVAVVKLPPAESKGLIGPPRVEDLTVDDL